MTPQALAGERAICGEAGTDAMSARLPDARAFLDRIARVWCRLATDTFTAILDYHHTGTGPARWCEHVATLQLRKSEEWKLWRENNGKRMTQAEMATFIEDNAIDVIEPKSADMIDVSRGLEAKMEVNFESGVRLANGKQQLVYQEEIKASVGSGRMDVPETFKLRLPVYDGLGETEITARFRYRIGSGKLTLWYDLLRPARAERDAYRAIAEQIKLTVGAVFSGKP